MNENLKVCPICPQGCDLSSPNCKRGAEYAKNGNLPQQQEHGHGEKHGHPARLLFAKKEQQLVMKYLHHAVGVADRGGITQQQANDMFSVLTEEETICLAELLEKLLDHWMQMAPNQHFHHGKP